MDCYRTILWSKIHRATVTQADLHYEGSITIPSELLKASKINPFEYVHIWNITRGTRLQTYTIEGEANSGDICINGAAAHLVEPGDLVIIANFISMRDSEIKKHKPTVVFVDEKNNFLSINSEIPGPGKRPD